MKTNRFKIVKKKDYYIVKQRVGFLKWTPVCYSEKLDACIDFINDCLFE